MTAAQATSLSAVWWIAPSIVAAVIAAAVAIITLVAQTRRNRLDRQRGIFAEAYGDIAAYCEFPYVIRRRHDDRSERSRITNEFSAIQQSINKHRALLRIESPQVSVAFEELVTITRAIAGSCAREGWEQPVGGADARASIDDVDLSGIEPARAAFLEAVSDHLSISPIWFRKRMRRLIVKK